MASWIALISVTLFLRRPFDVIDVSRKSVAEITDGLIPALQQRGLTRTGFGGKHLRDNLLEF